jgi:hypothetical protein
MTIDTFIRRLRKLRDGNWYIQSGVFIRRKDGSRKFANTCPIVAVNGGSGVAYWVHKNELGLSSEDAASLVEAADNKKANPKLRARLLRAVGLTEVVPAK